MKSVLISIRPEWCEKIASGEKTVEIRKTRPKLEPPFKVYIYQTKNRKHNGPTYSDGKVIGEFMCDRIRRDREVAVGLVDIVLEKTSCMSYGQIIRYADGGDLFSWHISDLMIYEKPKKLNELRSYEARVYLDENGYHMPTHEITRPPQSWCYVEEVTP